MESARHLDSYSTRQFSSRPFLVRDAIPRHFDGVPPLPVSPAVLLQLDLLLGQRSLDVEAIADVILADVGATLQVFRSSALLKRDSGERPTRIEDCIGWIGPRKLRQAIAPKGPKRAAHATRPVVTLWQRARLTAEIANTLSRRFAGMNPASAYLAGLLHEAGRVPAVLAWQVERVDLHDMVGIGRRLAHEWSFPAFVESTLQFAAGPAQSWTPLQRVVSTACDLANAVTNGRPLQRQVPLGPGEAGPAGYTEGNAVALRPIRIR